MRFLKNKIALSAQLKAQQASSPSQVQKESESQALISNLTSQKSIEEPKQSNSPKQTKKAKDDNKSSKTVVKNYGKAIASFAISQLAIPYLTPMVSQEKVKLNEFVSHVAKSKETIEGIDTFRALLLINEDDTPKMKAFKRIFQRISEIFIKYFSVNWIFSGRMVNKQTHLKFRFKILRRILNPHLFTYLK